MNAMTEAFNRGAPELYRAHVLAKLDEIARQCGTTGLAVQRLRKLCEDRSFQDEVLRYALEQRVKSLPGEGHVLFDTQRDHARPRQPDESGEACYAVVPKAGMPRLLSPNDGGGGHAPVGAQIDRAPATVTESDRKGHHSFDAHVLVARPVAPSPEQRAAALKSRAATALTIMDTYRLGNGQIVGDLYWGSLSRLRKVAAKDAALLQLMINHCQADPNMKVRDVLKVEDFQRMLQKSAEMADAA